jgi:hypothetical protein
MMKDQLLVKPKIGFKQWAAQYSKFLYLLPAAFIILVVIGNHINLHWIGKLCIDIK